MFDGRSFPKRYGTDAQLFDYNSGSINQKWTFEVINNINHIGDIKIGITSDSYRSGSSERCTYGGRVSGQCADWFAQYISGAMYTGYNNRVITFNRKDSQASKKDLQSKHFYSNPNENIDDVDFMVFIGHGLTATGLHFSFGANGELHSASPGNHTPDCFNFKHSEAKFGYGNARTKWVLAYTCNFLTPYISTTKQMLQGAHMVLSYGSTSYLIRNQLGAVGLDLKLAEKNIIDAYLASGDIHAAYNSSYIKLSVIYVQSARYDTIYNYKYNVGTYQTETISIITREVNK